MFNQTAVASLYGRKGTQKNMTTNYYKFSMDTGRKESLIFIYKVDFGAFAIDESLHHQIIKVISNLLAALMGLHFYYDSHIFST
jgi:hypothetical protein